VFVSVSGEVMSIGAAKAQQQLALQQQQLLQAQQSIAG
jgi:hypothetical protein